MQLDSCSLKAASSQPQVSHALMSCLFDPDPAQVALGRLHPGVSSVNSLRRQWPTAFLPGKARRSRALPWHHLLGRPKRAPTLTDFHGWSRSACRRGALAPLRTLRLCGESLPSWQAAPPIGKALWLASDLPAPSAYSPASGLLRRLSPSACRSPLAGEAPATG
jgi:hypothetical protein